MTFVFLLRHAESAPSRDLGEPDWPLSEEGERQAFNLLDKLEPLEIEHIFSSPFERAIASVRPFAERIGVEVEIIPDLRERKLKEGFVDNWAEILRMAWEDFDYSQPNCESGIACQTRIKDCIGSLATSHPGQVILASSHGNAIGLFLNSLDDSFGFDGWAAMGNPDLFRIIYKDGAPSWDRKFVYG